MRHRVAGRTFGRRPEGRKALLRGLADSLIEAGRITTTLEKAKELRSVVEPLVTLAKRGDLQARRRAAAVLYRPETLGKLFGEVAERFRARAGGYTRIYRLGRRVGDGAQEAAIELIPAEKAAEPKAKAEKKKTAKDDEGAKAAPKKGRARKKG